MSSEEQRPELENEEIIANASRRWYDETFIKNIIDSFKGVPYFKRKRLALRIIDIVESTFRLEIHHKINMNKKMVLGLYKEYERRRWYDQDPDVHRAIRCIFTLDGQKDDLKRKAISNIIDAIGEYFISEKPMVEIRKSPQLPVEPEPFMPQIPEDPYFNFPKIEEKQKLPQSKVKVSGEKLFLERATDKKKKNKVKLDDIDFKNL